jgi:hypothetical protein
MNWEQRIETNFSIQTGDGKLWFPLQKGGEKEREYNTSTFDFIKVYGTLVDRKKPQGARYNLVFYFEGADNIDQADQFESSCEDPRQWTVTHPFYGTIVGQPLSIRRDDSFLNITEITVPFFESISPDYPFSNFSKKDNTRDMHRATVYALSLSAADVVYAPNDIQSQNASLQIMASELSTLADSTTYADFQNALNSGLQAIDNLLAEPLNAIQTVQNFLDLPATYIRAIEGRVARYEGILLRLKESVETVADKKYYEAMAGTVLSLISVVLLSPITGDYVLTSDVEYYYNRLGTLYNDYLQTLDNLTVSVYDVNNTYTPDANAQQELATLMYYTIANLYEFTFGTRRLRIVVVTKDTNVILLTHKYLGLDALDENIDTFIATNNIKFNELFAIKKGREIRYVK